MGGNEAEQDQNNRIVRARANTNRVIVSVYIESPRKRSHENTDLANKTKTKPKPKPLSKKPQTTRKHGYDRRAQLLAYTHGLREAGTEQVHWSRKNSRPKSNNWQWSSAPVRIQASIFGMFQHKERHWSYERIAIEEISEVDQSCGPKCINSKNKKASKDNISKFCRKMKCILKKVSCGLPCNKG